MVCFAFYQIYGQTYVSALYIYIDFSLGRHIGLPLQFFSSTRSVRGTDTITNPPTFFGGLRLYVVPCFRRDDNFSFFTSYFFFRMQCEQSVCIRVSAAADG